MPRASVLPGFRQLTEAKEGANLPFMYLDVYGLVTTGNGNLIDTSSKTNVMGGTIPEVVYKYGWEIDGRPATREEIYSSWRAVKDRQDMREGGGVAYQNVPGNNVRLPREAIDRLYETTLTDFESKLRNYFPSYDSWPADAQLGALSMAWALGPHFSRMYPKFTRAANEGPVPDFATMALESGISDNKGRSDIQFTAFSNADAVVRGKGDPDTLYFPENIGELIRQGVSIAKANPGKTGLGGLALFAGLSWFGIKYAQKKGWVRT